MPGKYFRRGSEDIDAGAPLQVNDCEGVNIGHLLSAVTNFGFVHFLPLFQRCHEYDCILARDEVQRIERPLEGDYSRQSKLYIVPKTRSFGFSFERISSDWDDFNVFKPSCENLLGRDRDLALVNPSHFY